MKSIFSSAILGAALLVTASVPASANTLSVFVSAQQIITATNAITGAFGGACGAGTNSLASCGVWEIGFVSDTANSTAEVLTSNASSFWSAQTVLGNVGSVDTGGAGGREQLISTSSTTPTGQYNANFNATFVSVASPAFIPTTNGFTFNLTTAATGGSDTITLVLRAVGITSGTGAQGVDKGTQNITVTSNLTAAPEPSSILFMVSGIAAIGFGKLRLRRR